MNKKEFIREVARRSNFTISNVKDIWKAVEEVFMDAIRQRIELDIRGFGKLYFSNVKKRKRYTISSGGVEEFSESERASFRLSEKFTNLLK